MIDLGSSSEKLTMMKGLHEQTTFIYGELMRVTEHARLQQGGRWKNPILYKTKMCDHLVRDGVCRFAHRCWYAHNSVELRHVIRLDQVPQLLNELGRKIAELEHKDFGYASQSSSSPRDPSPNSITQLTTGFSLLTAADVAAEQWTLRERGVRSAIGPFPHCNTPPPF